MNSSDSEQFQALMTSMLALYGREAGKPVLRIWWQALGGFELADISRALSAHTTGKRGHFPPLPADVINFLKPANNGHLPTEEAWALALTTADEAVTVVWTAEIAQAFGVAKPCLDLGDKFGARQAFVSAYERLVAVAGAPCWQVSMGHDATCRADAVAEAVRLGRLEQSQVAHLLPAPITAEGAALAGVLTGRVVEPEATAANLSNLARIRELAAMLKADNERRDAEARAARQKAMEDFRARQAAVLAELQGVRGDTQNYA